MHSSDTAMESRGRLARLLHEGAWVLGEDPAMRRLADHLQRAAEFECTVLITGETGTGKEIFARLLHALGPRSERPFLPVNCAALTPSLAESQLFGHEAGAFTGARGASLGVFRAAHEGTVFLDEIGEMPLELQPKLLRVLQEGEVTPVGSVQPVPVDVLVVAATNRDLQQEVRHGRFREDLYFRLNLVELHIPPLRERPLDVPRLIEFFSERFARQYRRPLWVPDAKLLDRLIRYPWPGNVRQLAHWVQQVYVLGQPQQLAGEPDDPPNGSPTRLPCLDLQQLRRLALKQALQTANGHKGLAAQLLGVHPNTLTRMLRELEEELGARE